MFDNDCTQFFVCNLSVIANRFPKKGCILLPGFVDGDDENLVAVVVVMIVVVVVVVVVV